MNDQKSLIKVLCIAIAILGFMTFSQQRQIETTSSGYVPCKVCKL